MNRITSALLTDLYELTMIQGYYYYHRNPQVVFDMFFRKQPFHGGFSVFAGLEDLLETLRGLHFSQEDLEYLEQQGSFTQEFLQYLADFRFEGDVYAMPEGTVVFPHEPLVRIHSTLIEAQLIESLLLNILNFQTLIATKTARIYLAANEGKVLEFGLRRAQGMDGALSASRAAYVGGAAATSNTLAGRYYGIPVSGTMAHSWVMAFEDEREAFQRFADLYPDNSILLIDTYDTLHSGLPNAIEIGKQLQRRGQRLGVRLDSGDLQYLSQKVRQELDAAGLEDAVIAASNELNEEIIHQLVVSNTPIDLWGVGTHMVTGGSEASFPGVYKLAAKGTDGQIEPTMKLSDNPEKSTNPGVKQVYRYYDDNGSPIADLMAFVDEDVSAEESRTFYHPYVDFRHFTMTPPCKIAPLLEKRMEAGEVLGDHPPLSEVRDNTRRNLEALDFSYKRLINPHIYKVSISQAVKDTKVLMIERFMENGMVARG
jgi:nicotinate phosphoribosyltransferase